MSRILVLFGDVVQRLRQLFCRHRWARYQGKTVCVSCFKQFK